jgi:excisionase family DNA binding protein
MDTMSINQAAETLGLSRSTLARLRISGGGPRYVKLGRKVLYLTEDMQAWLDSHRRWSTSQELN